MAGTVRLATATRNAACNAQVDLLDGGNAPATIKIYSGTQPASANDGIGGATLLATFTLEDPAFGAASSGTATLEGTPLTTTGDAAGTATWFRAETGGSGGVGTVFDGSVTATGGGGVMELNTTTVSVGVNVEITSGSYTQPSGE